MTTTNNTDFQTFDVGCTPCGCDADTTEYDVPVRFFEDHADRGCLNHAVTAYRVGKLLRVSLRPCDVSELMSDASHYATSTSDYGPELFGLCSSARATVNRLKKVGK